METTMMRRVYLALAAAVILAAGTACDGDEPTEPTTPVRVPGNTAPHKAPPRTECYGPDDPLCDKTIEIPPPDLGHW